jgi:hypothetical protein
MSLRGFEDELPEWWGRSIGLGIFFLGALVALGAFFAGITT